MQSKRRRILLLTIILATLSVAGFLLVSKHASPKKRQLYRSNLINEMQNAKDFESFTNSLFCYEVTSDSITTAYTLKNTDSYHIPALTPVLSDFSNTEYQRELKDQTQQKLFKSLYGKLKSFNYSSLNSEEQITYKLLEKHFDRGQNEEDYSYYEELIGSQTGIQANLPITLSEYPLRREKDVNDYLALLAEIPDYFDNIIAYEKTRATLGYESPAFLLNETKDNIKEMTESMNNGTDCFTETFAPRINQISEIPKKKKSEYIEKNAAYVKNYVLPAYERLYQYVDNCLDENKLQSKDTKKQLAEYSSRKSGYLPTPDIAYGLASLPKGKEYYSMLVAANTGSCKDIPRLISMTEQALNQAISDVYRIATTDTASYLYYCDHPLETYYQSPDAILEALSLMCRSNYPALPITPSYETKTVPKSLQKCSSPAFYMIPAIDDYENNTIYINPIYTSTENGNLFTTLAHEGFPGHMYQTVYYNSTSPAALRQLLDYPGYVEGWATYVEMDSFSYLDYGDKSSLCELYRADTLINLALCSRVDLGVHYEGWTLGDVNAFFNENGFKSYYAADLYAYVVQAPAVYLRYFIGYLEILELKDEYQRLKMEDYSDKEFHKALLDIGPADFSTIREALLK